SDSFCAQNRLECSPDEIGHDPMASGGGMNQIWLVEIAVTADSLEQEWDENGVVLTCELAVSAFETGRVLRAEIWGNLHPGEHDFDLGILYFRLVDDRLQICFHRFQIQPAQSVIGPEFEHENIDAALEQPVDPAQATGARVAAQPR